MSEITIPFGEIGILEVINHGSRTPRKMLTFGNWAPGGVRSQKLLHSFPANTPFAYQVPEGELGEYAPMAVFYTVVPHECTQRFWDERKKDFSRSFSAKVHAFKRQYEGMMLSDMVRKGILLGRGTEAAQGCHWSVVILGVGPAVCMEKDPFDIE